MIANRYYSSFALGDDFDRAASRQPAFAGRTAADREYASRELLKEMSHSGNHRPGVSAVRILIKMGADLEAVDETWGQSALSMAAGSHETEIVKALVDGGADWNKFDVYGHTPFMRACGDGYLDLVQYFLDKGVDVNARNPNGDTALLMAANPGCRTEAAQLLVKAGADVAAADAEGKTAFDYCREGKDSYKHWGGRSGREVFTELEKALLDGWYDGYVKAGKPPVAPEWASKVLNAAVAQGDETIAAAMLAAGADPSAPDIRGTTPLHWAADGGNEPLIELLLIKGADIDARDGQGRTPLARVQAAENKGVEEFLVNTWPKVRKLHQERQQAEFEGQFEKGTQAAVRVSRIRFKGSVKPGGVAR